MDFGSSLCKSRIEPSRPPTSSSSPPHPLPPLPTITKKNLLMPATYMNIRLFSSGIFTRGSIPARRPRKESNVSDLLIIRLPPLELPTRANFLSFLFSPPHPPPKPELLSISLLTLHDSRAASRINFAKLTRLRHGVHTYVQARNLQGPWIKRANDSITYVYYDVWSMGYRKLSMNFPLPCGAS